MNSVIISQKSLFHSTISPPPLKPPTKLHTFLYKTPKWRQNANSKGFTPTKQPKPSSENPIKAQKTDEKEEDEIPREVFNRIIVRVCVFVGVPMVLGYGFLGAFGALREQGVDVPKWVPFVTSMATFGSSCFGIAYGALSTSLDPEREGSLLGLEEAEKHWGEMWEEEDKAS